MDRSWLRRLHDFFLPHSGNGYKPGIFLRDAVIGIAAALLFLQVSWFAVSTFVLKNPSFLGAVLPGALTALANADRAQNGAGALAENQLLDKAAQAKADDMAAKGYFSHVSPDGTTPWHWLDAAGYRYTYAGENLAVDFSDSADVENAWMHSPAHRANIVKPQYTQVGIGVANGTYQGHPATFVVQFFGTPAPSASPALVAETPVRAPAPEAADAPAPTHAAPAPEVLGAANASPAPEVSATQTAPAVNAFLMRIAASPNRTLLYAMGGFFAFIALLFFLAVFMKVKVQYLEVLAGGIILLAAAGGSLLAIQAVSGDVQLPADSQSASVYAGVESALRL